MFVHLILIDLLFSVFLSYFASEYGCDYFVMHDIGESRSYVIGCNVIMLILCFNG